MNRVQQRYAEAVHSSNLAVDPKTVMSDSDTLCAMSWAGRALSTGRGLDGEPIKKTPLSVPLERLFAGDNNAVHDIVRQIAGMAYEHSFKLRLKLNRTEARMIAEACLAWYRNGTCTACEGRGRVLIAGTRTLSDKGCPECCGSHIPARWRTPGKIPFERQFRPEWRDLARWLVVQMDDACGRAGPEAMKALAPRLDL